MFINILSEMSLDQTAPSSAVWIMGEFQESVQILGCVSTFWIALILSAVYLEVLADQQGTTVKQPRRRTQDGKASPFKGSARLYHLLWRDLPFQEFTRPSSNNLFAYPQ